MKLTKLQLQEMIREVISEASDEDKLEFKKYLLSKYKNKKVDGGFKVAEDRKTGALIWSNGNVNIYATPFWKGDESLQVIVQEDDGYELYDRTFKFKYIPDQKKMEMEYFKILKPILINLW
jgi:hypothetical protein